MNTFLKSSFVQQVIRKQWLGKAFLLVLTALAFWRLAGAFQENPILFGQQVVNGLRLGFVYALIALGYTMVYGIVRLINFAHGDVFMFGAFVSFYLITRFKLHTWLSAVLPGVSASVSLVIGAISVMAVTMAACALLAIVIERVAYKPLRSAPRISALITAIGISFFLEYFAALDFVFSANFITYKSPIKTVSWAIGAGGVTTVGNGVAQPSGSILISNITLIIIATSLVLMFALQFIVARTRIGKAMRSVAYDKETARLMGINADAIVSITFAIGAALAGAAGMIYAIAFPQIAFSMGITPGLKSFVAAVLGGIGSIPGAVVGALIMGQAEVMSAAYISTPMRDAIAFSILIIVLLVRPTGIYGEPEREKA